MDNKKTLIGLLIVLVVVVLLLAIGQYNRNKDFIVRLDTPAPLPDDLVLDTEGSKVSQYADLVGTWTGVWAGNIPELAMNGSFTIKSINEENIAEVIYSWGNNEGIGITEGFIETIARIDGRVIEVQMRDPMRLVFLIDENGLNKSLAGFFDNAYATVGGTFEK